MLELQVLTPRSLCSPPGLARGRGSGEPYMVTGGLGAAQGLVLGWSEVGMPRHPGVAPGLSGHPGLPVLPGLRDPEG